jgi:hypothetical protein
MTQNREIPSNAAHIFRPDRSGGTEGFDIWERFATVSVFGPHSFADPLIHDFAALAGDAQTGPSRNIRMSKMLMKLERTETF